MTSSSHIPWDEGLLRSHRSQAGGRDRHGPEETSASSPAAGRPQALRAGETSAQTPRGSSPQGGALAAAAKDHRWADSFSPRSPSSRCRQDLAPHPPGGPRGGTFWPLPAPGGFRRPTRTKSRAQLQDLESPGRVTAVSVCLHLYVASLPPGSDVRLGPLFEGPCDIRPLDNPGSPSHLSVLRYTCKHPASA